MAARRLSWTNVVHALILVDIMHATRPYLGLLLKTPGTVMTLSWTVLMPLTFASSIYVEVSTMPEWLQRIVAVNPVTLIVTAVRGLLDGGVTAGQVWLSLLAPAVVTPLVAPVAMVLYRREG